ncbi:MAG: hypothetical protein HYZ72_13895 [Deltaproteobacteria bacterium]|nr:hypothetical protein [Deltaproteobacteria bacterium]
MSKEEVLAASTDMTPVQGFVEVAVPLAIMWESFTHANWWPRWNTCFFWVWNPSLIAGKHLILCFEPIRWWYLYKMPAIAKIVEVEERHKVTWEVTALPGFYARHTYFMENLGNGRTRFGSYEKAMGWSFRLLKWFWIAHFVFVKERSLAGARVLEEEYRKTGTIMADTLPSRRSWRSFLPLVLLLAVVVIILFLFGHLQ